MKSKIIFASIFLPFLFLGCASQNDMCHIEYKEGNNTRCSQFPSFGGQCPRGYSSGPCPSLSTQ